MNLVFFDIDGTLATGKVIPESAKKAIAELREKGDLVFICTGRSHSYVKRFFEPYADGFICSNGRFAIREDEVLYDARLTMDQIREIKEIVNREDGDCIFFGQKEGWYGGDPARYPEEGNEEAGVLHREISGDMVAYNFNIYFRDKAHREQITKALEGLCLVNPHGPMPHADVTVLGSDKGTALRHVAEALNVPIENTYAFGDGVNDICMLEAAGHGIAMGNAVDATKEKAEYVTANINDDGVMKGLQHYGLIGGNA